MRGEWECVGGGGVGGGGVRVCVCIREVSEGMCLCVCTCMYKYPCIHMSTHACSMPMQQKKTVNVCVLPRNKTCDCASQLTSSLQEYSVRHL